MCWALIVNTGEQASNRKHKIASFVRSKALPKVIIDKVATYILILGNQMDWSTEKNKGRGALPFGDALSQLIARLRA
jgi:hypothetical protein